MVRNFEIDEADQRAISYIESSKMFLSLVLILFSQKFLILKLNEKILTTISHLLPQNAFNN